jgi:hypothetical protein
MVLCLLKKWTLSHLRQYIPLFLKAIGVCESPIVTHWGTIETQFSSFFLIFNSSLSRSKGLDIVLSYPISVLVVVVSGD